MNIYFRCRELLMNHSSHPMAQLIKYGIFGTLSAATGAIILASLYFCYPDYVAETLPAQQRALHVNVFNTLAFVPSSIVAYLTNRAYVFNTGRHSQLNEFLIFMAIASVSYVFGFLSSNWAVEQFEAPSWTGTLAFMFFSALINFVCRKFIVFKN